MANEVEIVITSRDRSAAGFKEAKQSAEELAGGLDKVGEAGDSAETRAQGFSDTVTGMQDVLSGTALLAKGPSFEAFATLGGGIADLGGGIFNFLVPALKALSLTQLKSAASTVASTTATVASKVATTAAASASKAWAAAQWVLNAALTANPIGIVVVAVAALVAGIILAYRHSETFRRIVAAAGAAAVTAFRAVLGAVSAVIGWVRANWPLLLTILTGPIGIAVRLVLGNLDRIGGWFKAIPGAAKAAFGAVYNHITASIAAVVKWALGKLNELLEFVKGIPGKIKDAVGGALSSVAHGIVPGFAHGGVVGASGLVRMNEQGAELVQLPTGSRIYPSGAAPAGGGAERVIVELRVVGNSNDWLVQLLRRLVRTGVIKVATR